MTTAGVSTADARWAGPLSFVTMTSQSPIAEAKPSTESSPATHGRPIWSANSRSLREPNTTVCACSEPATCAKRSGGHCFSGTLAPGERIGIDRALRAITIDAAHILRLDAKLGSIEVGKYADFTVLDEDPYAVDPMALKDIPIWGTVLGGVKQPA